MKLNLRLTSTRFAWFANASLMDELLLHMQQSFAQGYLGLNVRS